MRKIFVNLKRFDVSRKFGGICCMENPSEWIKWVMEQSVKYRLGKMENIQVIYLLPEALIVSALEKLASYAESEVKNLHIGCQGVFRENIVPGGNFGAFTTNLPAAAAKNLGCTWSIMGHSEERRDKLGIIKKFTPSYNESEELRVKAANTIHGIINQEVLCALNSGLNVLLCIGETAEERGNGTFEEQKPKIQAVLKSQLEIGLKGVQDKLSERKIVIGYEPIWAIGPGKILPKGEYISFVSAYIKFIVKEMYGFGLEVVYGGGLKEENAEIISRIKTIDGGLVALTRFSGDIAFEPKGLAKIIEKYRYS